ncbi:unnamed protein product [Cyprideis torosa]|uniref:Carboxypeptidase n=1 Tax=Cyprideis torosa TaxID=163714 RepID=A0A7R8WJ82_9CRUS|nr:unnamed protein product [Cyprideis torosa]CAG0901690.1 unnamed protein product [Cyprideis torosa]
MEPMTFEEYLHNNKIQPSGTPVRAIERRVTEFPKIMLLRFRLDYALLLCALRLHWLSVCSADPDDVSEEALNVIYNSAMSGVIPSRAVPPEVTQKAYRTAEEDRIQALPGLDQPPNFRQYSGYLNASDGKYLHYWFVESQRNPSRDPVILWLNGGPGCSSVDGLLSELGPFHIREDGKTVFYNPWSWNKFGNVIFLESPAGVGFSYASDGNLTAGDASTAVQNYAALLDFFRKFPQFRKNDLYITGESYGGFYVPTLASVTVADGKLNLKGIAVGNGLSSNSLNDESLVFFAYYHGLIGEEVWSALRTHCCRGMPVTRENCDFQRSGLLCTNAVSGVFEIVWRIGLNVYNLYAECPGAPQGNTQWARYATDMKHLFSHARDTSMPILKRYEEDRYFKIDGDHTYFHKRELDPPCINDTRIIKYLNDPKVRQALHIPDRLPHWTVCSSIVSENYVREFNDMSPFYRRLIRSKIKILIYNGDVDMACSFLGDEWFVDKLNLDVEESRRPWRSQGQIAGFVKRYNGIDLITIKGSGHMAPKDKPVEMYKVITTFIDGNGERY